MKMYMATGDALATIGDADGRRRVELTLQGKDTQCVTAYPLRPESILCGTFGQGLWRSDDAGRSWRQASEGIPYEEITAVAVSRLERDGDIGVLWAGTEPSAIFRSEDGGGQWIERPALRELPSAPTWSFPPRPWTSHVRWIALDPIQADRLFVGIELGGVMRSGDGGRTWEDRKPNSQHDAHTLRTHPNAPDRLYEAAGGGYAETRDGGDTYQHFDEGLTRTYVWGLAVDPGDPDTVLVSAAPGPREAHNADWGDAAIYRRRGDGAWQEIGDGLPHPRGTRTYVLTTVASQPGLFFAATRDGDVYQSDDAGSSWEQLEIEWPEGYRPPDVRGFIVVEG